MEYRRDGDADVEEQVEEEENASLSGSSDGGESGDLGADAASEFSRSGGESGDLGADAASESSRSGGESDGSRIARWLRALDMQTIGACRADERLKPLLKLNSSTEDRVIAQLSQHFELSEIAMLARCLCMPLISVRVGKVDKQGNRLCPIAVRGNLNLALLPSSIMRLSFVGDDGVSEHLVSVSSEKDDSDYLSVEEISADASARSFLLKLPGPRVLYYWCSEKSRDHGMELLGKMKDLLKERPSLSHLTGISKSRLDSFASHMQAFLLGSSSGNVKSFALLNDFLNSKESYSSPVSSATVSKNPRMRFSVAQTSKACPAFQASLSPRSNAFKEGMPRASSLKSAAREILKIRGAECQPPSISTELIDLYPTLDTLTSLSTSPHGIDHSKVNNGDCPLNLLDFVHLFPSAPPSSFINSPSPAFSDSFQASAFKPYYCWCPPSPSLKYAFSPVQLSSTSAESLPLPPLSTLLSDVNPSLSAMLPPLAASASDLPSINFPTFIHDPLIHLPLPLSSIVPLPVSQIPTFTPLMLDPIVHLPMLDICSSGPVYLVSAGPTMPSSVPPLLPSFVNPLIPETKSFVERSARETLRHLIASAPTPASSQFISVLPALLSNVDKDRSFNNAAGADESTPSQLLGPDVTTSAKSCNYQWNCDAKINNGQREDDGDDDDSA